MEKNEIMKSKSLEYRFPTKKIQSWAVLPTYWKQDMVFGKAFLKIWSSCGESNFIYTVLPTKSPSQAVLPTFKWTPNHFTDLLERGYGFWKGIEDIGLLHQIKLCVNCFTDLGYSSQLFYRLHLFYERTTITKICFEKTAKQNC